MISDGKNLMLNSREEYRLYLLLKGLYDDSPRYFRDDNEEDLIMRRWVDSMLAAVEEARHNPMRTVDL